MARQKPGEPERPYNPDAEFFRSYGVGCAVILLAFLLGTCVIAYFWLHG